MRARCKALVAVTLGIIDLLNKELLRALSAFLLVLVSALAVGFSALLGIMVWLRHREQLEFSQLVPIGAIFIALTAPIVAYFLWQPVHQRFEKLRALGATQARLVVLLKTLLIAIAMLVTASTGLLAGFSWALDTHVKNGTEASSVDECPTIFGTIKKLTCRGRDHSFLQGRHWYYASTIKISQAACETLRQSAGSPNNSHCERSTSLGWEVVPCATLGITGGPDSANSGDTPNQQVTCLQCTNRSSSGDTYRDGLLLGTCGDDVVHTVVQSANVDLAEAMEKALKTPSK